MNKNIFFFTLTCFLSTASLAADSNTPQEASISGKQVGQIQTELIKEASGITASRKNPGVLWIHNDSGNSPEIYALNIDGKLLGNFRVEGATCRDWEDIAIGPGPDEKFDYLYIGDIGDNDEKHSSIIIYRVPEPAIDPNNELIKAKTETAEKIELVYPDGAKDAETLMVDPLNGDIYIVSKRRLFSRVYRAAYPHSTKQKTTMSPVTVIPMTLATGGDISEDGRYTVIRNLSHASIWIRPKDKPLQDAFSEKSIDITLMSEPQGEAICFDASSSGFFTVSEKKNPFIYYFTGLDALNEKNN